MYLKDSDVAVLDDEERFMNANSIPADDNSAIFAPADVQRLSDLGEHLLAN